MACLSSGGIKEAILPPKAAVVLLGSRPPMALTIPRTTLTSLTRAATNASRLRTTAKAACVSARRCLNRSQQVHVDTAESRQHSGIQPIVLMIAVVDHPNLARVGYDYFVPITLELAAYPRGVCACF